MNSKWAEIGLDAYRSAQLLHANERFRSSISRAYYCGYSALAAVLSDIKGVRFGHGGNNPAHESLAKLVKHLDSRVYSHSFKRGLNAVHKTAAVVARGRRLRSRFENRRR